MNSINHVAIMREYLDNKIAQTIEDVLVAKYLKMVEHELRETIKNQTAKLSLEVIEKTLNAVENREEFAVWFKWNEEEREKLR